MNQLSKLLLVVSSALFLVFVSLAIVASEFTQLILIVFSISLVTFLTFIVLNLKLIKRILSSKLFKNFVSHATMVFLSLGILGMINYFVVKNDQMIDFTQAKYHTLSNQSLSIVESVCSKNEKVK